VIPAKNISSLPLARWRTAVARLTPVKYCVENDPFSHWRASQCGTKIGTKKKFPSRGMTQLIGELVEKIRSTTTKVLQRIRAKTEKKELQIG
jgi:hypothetical protein